MAVQSIAAMGTDGARKDLEELMTSCASKEARGQCKFLLDGLYYPFQGKDPDPAILGAIEKAEMKELKYAPGGWLDRYERLLRRLVHAGRKDLIPRLLEITARFQERDPEAVAKRPLPLTLILRAIHGLGGELTEEEKRH